MNIPPCPIAGQGAHVWLMTAANVCKRAGIPAEEAIDILTGQLSRPPRPANEVAVAVAKSYDSDIPLEHIVIPQAEFSPESLKTQLAKLPHRIDPGWLMDHSPIQPWNRTPASFLHAITNPGEIMLVFTKFDSPLAAAKWENKGLPFNATALNEFRSGYKDGIWFLCNPVDGEMKLNERLGHVSCRAEENITSYRYMVLESDCVEMSDWAGILVQLALPIVAITSSGGKSLHALVKIAARNRFDFDAFRARIAPPLIRVGADKGAMSAVRLTRLPQCKRGDRNQALVWLNPAADGTPILET